MTHHVCRVAEYHVLRPVEFPDLDSMELCQLVPPEVETAESVLSLHLRPRAGGDSRRLCLRFWGVRDLKVRQTTSVITIPFLEVSCIAERQWDGVHYKVQDTEHGSISFYCGHFEGRIEAE